MHLRPLMVFRPDKISLVRKSSFKKISIVKYNDIQT